MNRIILLCVLLLNLNGLHAQLVIPLDTRIIVCGGEPSIGMSPAQILDSAIIDTQRLSIKYRFTHPRKTKKTAVWSNILLQIGQKCVKQQDRVLYCDHLMQTRRRTDDDISRMRAAEGIIYTDIFSEIYCDIQQKEMTVVCGDFFDRDRMKDYQQPLPLLAWQLCEDTKQVCGYHCHAATADYGGRKWSVWYTTEIPYSYGPWKLNGLPGMILYATDNDCFTFECVEISGDNAPIVRYKYISVQHMKTLSNYLRYERNCFEHPSETFTQGKEGGIYYRNAERKVVRMSESESLPYNPIERND